MPPSTYNLGRWLFLRLLGLVYLIAFGSIFVQIDGLIGSHGILPAHQFLAQIHEHLGSDCALALPTLAWLNDSDAGIKTIALAGIVSSLLVLIEILPAASLAICYVCYLSLISISQDFLGFQWDWLLLEAGFLAIFLSPLSFLGIFWSGPQKLRQQTDRPIILVLMRFLVFKLMFMSGMCKLASGDPTWSGLTALDYHFYTQPLPTPVAYFAALLPSWSLKLGVAATFFIELLAPFAVFGPRRCKLFAAACFIFLQVIIAVTGNYAFFNLLTIMLCLPLLDDALLVRLMPQKLVSAIESVSAPGRTVEHCISIAVAVLISVLTVALMQDTASSPTAAGWFARTAMRCGIVNRYGLFATMTTSRKEIIIEGSEDGEHWQTYEFFFKPGDIKQPPCVVAPHQPRLDWQMWFAALGEAEQSPWFTSFMQCLLEGKPEVTRLLKTNPFAAKPPVYVRAKLYDYKFSPPAKLWSEGVWWQRQPAGDFFPICSLQRKQGN